MVDAFLRAARMVGSFREPTSLSALLSHFRPSGSIVKTTHWPDPHS